MIFLFQSQEAANSYAELSLQVFLANIENVLLFLLLAFALLLIVSAPVFLIYQTGDNWIKIKKYKSIIDQDICCENHTTHKSYEKKVCKKYINNYALFYANLISFSVWLIVSVIYINTQYVDLLTGVMSYFEFPFTILESVDFKNVFATLNSYKSSWFFMMGIILVTAVSYLISKFGIAKYIEQIVSKKVPHIALHNSVEV